MRHKGKITTWHDDKGYGFITPFDGGKQVFVHVKAFGNRSHRPQVNDVATFSMSSDKQGRPCAANAVLAGNRLKPGVRDRRGSPAIAVAVLFLAAVGTSIGLNLMPLFVGVVYAALSLITFGAYAWDKYSASRGAWRTAEGSLHLLGLVGGWPGALIAQQVLRHKSRKTSFMVALWATALINGGAFLWLHTERGHAVMQPFMN